MHKSNLFLKKQFKLQSNSDPSPKKNPKQNLQNFENKTIVKLTLLCIFLFAFNEIN